MNRVKSRFMTLLIICFAVCVANQDKIDSLVNKNVERKIDLSSHLVKISTKITLENSGRSSTRYFIYSIEASFKNNLAFIGAVTKTDESDDTKLKVAETTISSAQKNVKFWRVELPSELAPGKTITVSVDTVFTHFLRPHPAQINQNEKQFVRYAGNLYYYSPYTTESQTTTVALASSSVESYTQTKPATKTESNIAYGPYTKRAAFTEAELAIHYENNTPFLTVTHLTRLIEVSHWGNIAVEESIDMIHSGSKLKGSFSRYDYQRSQDGASSVKSFKTMLPTAARDVYYRDEIGNISTSNMKESDDAVEVELRPRFPLFGGWKTHYILGYNVPSYQYLFNKGNNYALKMRFVDHIYDDQVIDEMTVQIILPEFSKNIQVKSPFAIRQDKNELHYTYLDTLGRPVITLHKSNVVEQHTEEFVVQYNFDKFLLLQEPMLVVCAFWLLFTIVIIYVRLDFSITKDEVSESRMRVAGLIEQIQSAFDKRSACYQAYQDAINKLKSSKDNSAFVANRKKIDGDHKHLTDQLKGYQAQLKEEGADIAEKVAEVNRLDVSFRELVTTQVTYVEKLIAGKVNKQQFIEIEGNLNGKKDDLADKMESIMAVF